MSGGKLEYDGHLLVGMKPTAGWSGPSVAVACPPASTCFDVEEDWQQANLGALFASSWTKQRLAALCHTALASATAIFLLFVAHLFCRRRNKTN